MQIKIRNEKGEIITIDAELNESVQQIKKKIEQATGISVAQQDLKANGKDLHNRRRVEEVQFFLESFGERYVL